MRCPTCKKATVIQIATEPRQIHRCVSCGVTFAPIIMSPDFFQKWNQSYIDAGKQMKADAEAMVAEHLGLD